MKFMHQLLFFLIILFCSLSLRTVKAQTPPLNTVIINQIRGNETCCESGTSEMVEQIMSDSKFQSLPINWAIRFDALSDPVFQSLFHKKPAGHVLGLLLEVTPKLASESGVRLPGDKNSLWSEARQAFLVGYTQDERRRILDTLFNKFYTEFGYYPSFTVSWLVDAWSLNYIRDNYGVRVHEITKEQYATDGYTLYGGVFNLPYFPSVYHPLIPGNNINKLDLMLLRQTISDLDKNYGSAKSIFTSQPNDYINQTPPADFTYFQKLISQMQRQSQASKVAVLGLENSAEWTHYKGEYLKQLDYIVGLVNKAEIKLLSAYDLYQKERQSFSQITARILQSGDFPDSGKLWYFGKNYRALIEIWEGLPVLSDLRIYGKFSDPYIKVPLDSSQAYWIVPYLIDSSQQFIEPINDTSLNRGDLIRTDAKVTRFGISLSDTSIKQIEQTDDGLILHSQNGYIKFTDKEIILQNIKPKLLTPVNLTLDEIMNLKTERFVFFSRHPRFFIIPGETDIKLGWESKNLEPVVMGIFFHQENRWVFKPNLDLTQADIDKLSSIFQPDRSDYGFEPSTSIFFWHNTQAIAGRNAVRLYINPLNILKRAAQIKQMEVRLTNSEKIHFTSPPLGTQEPFFIDFTASEPTTSRVNLVINNNMIGLNQEITFVTDCYQEQVECLKDKKQMQQYLQIRVKELKQVFKEKARYVFVKLQNQIKILLQKPHD